MQTEGKQTRVIGITHRVKKTKKGEARPTLVAIKDGDTTNQYKLETEQDELDFVLGCCPIKHRPVEPGEDVSSIKEHHVKFRSVEEEDLFVTRHPSQCRYKMKRGKKGEPNQQVLIEVADKVPTHYIGITEGDRVAMMLGGSGDYFAFALSVALSRINGAVYRIPPFKIHGYRGNESKDDDAILLVKIFEEHFEDFYDTQVRGRSAIRLMLKYRELMTIMRDRIACEQRMYQRHRDMSFCSEDGLFPQGSLIKMFEARKANDPILAAYEAEEARADKELKAAVYKSDIWQNLFEEIPGVGHRIAARIINAVIDIRRFKTEAKLCKYMGVHVLPDGRFPRRRNGEVANWKPDGRQGLFLLGDQFVRQKGKTYWSAYQIKRKDALKLKHPKEVIGEKGKKKYTKGHIHRMAIWRTLTRYTEWMHRQWWKLERSAALRTDEVRKAA